MAQDKRRRYVPANDRTYEPTDDPTWWRDVEECDRSWCGHPVHALGSGKPARHLEWASVVEAEGIEVAP